MKKIILLLMLLSMSFFTIESSAEDNNQVKTTQDILMNYKWIPIDMYDSDNKETCFLSYTKTLEIDSTKTEDDELEIYVATYYLSDIVDSVFDKTKIGKATTGKYLIMNRSDDTNVINTYIYELVELSETKMVMKYLTPGMDVYSRTNTFLASPK